MHDHAPQPAAGPALHQIRRRYVALGLVLVALILLGALILIRHDKTRDTPAASETFTAAPSSLLSTVSQIPGSVSNAVGVTSPTNPVEPLKTTGNATVWRATVKGSVAKPVVFFYGAEFTPYAATERWPLVVALARFGRFEQIGQLQSSPTEVFPNLSTFTFWHVAYASKWITLRTVERYGAVNPTGARYIDLQTPDAVEAAAVAAYDTSAGTFPLLDVANRYVLVGSSFTPAALAGLSQAEIAADLAFPTSSVTQAVLSAANEITAAICSSTAQQPVAVCSARGVVAADAKLGINPAS